MSLIPITHSVVVGFHFVATTSPAMCCSQPQWTSLWQSMSTIKYSEPHFFNPNHFKWINNCRSEWI